tara:strand:+ start:1200 stop:2438 length:1239 start_codon:yes stop_codon:yes gene_type:complete
MSLLSLDQDVAAARLRTANSPRQAYEALAQEKAYDYTKAHNLRQTPESRARDEAILSKATAKGLDVTPKRDYTDNVVAGLDPMQAAAFNPTPGQALNMFSRDYLEKVDRRAGLMDAFDILFAGRPSGNSKKYRESAIAKYTDYVNNQAAQIALNGDYADSASFMGAFLRAGGDIEKALALGQVVDFGGSSDEYKEMTFSDPQNPNALYSGYIIERKGEAPQRFMRVADGSVVEVPYNYINKSSGGQNFAFTMQTMKPGDAITSAMIDTALTTVKKTRGYYLDKDGKLIEKNWKDQAALAGVSRTARLNLESALMQALRLESGAAISVDEKQQFIDLWAPTWWDYKLGDAENIIRDKFDRLEMYLTKIAKFAGIEGVTDAAQVQFVKDIIRDEESRRAQSQTDNPYNAPGMSQ